MTDAMSYGEAPGDAGPEMNPTMPMASGADAAPKHDADETGFTCLDKFPVTGGFFTSPSKHGLP